MNYPNLRKLSEYYDDAFLKGDEVHQLAEEFKQYKQYIKQDYHDEVDELISKLLNSDVAEVEFWCD